MKNFTGFECFRASIGRKYGDIWNIAESSDAEYYEICHQLLERNISPTVNNVDPPFTMFREGITRAAPMSPTFNLLIGETFILDTEDSGVESDVLSQSEMFGVRFDVIKN